MKRRDLLNQIRQYAADNGLDLTETEGGNHTKIAVGNKRTVVARHNEIPDVLAKKIMKQIGATS